MDEKAILTLDYRKESKEAAEDKSRIAKGDGSARVPPEAPILNRVSVDDCGDLICGPSALRGTDSVRSSIPLDQYEFGSDMPSHLSLSSRTTYVCV